MHILFPFPTSSGKINCLKENHNNFFITNFQEEYFRRHPRSPNPILPNDIFFVVHGTWAAIFTGVQALMYAERGHSLSVIGQVICALYGLTFTISAALLVGGLTHLLDFLYICSLIKLVVTVTKYVPQVSLCVKCSFEK